MKPKRFEIGDSCLCWSLGDRISEEISSRVLGLYRAIKDDPSFVGTGILDLVPSYNALSVHFAPAHSDPQQIIKYVEDVIARRPGTDPGKTTGKHVEISVRYSGEDLGRVATLNGLTIQEVIQRHTAVRYTVAMIGFLPHFPYLIGLDSTLETPRRETPRTAVPAGAVAIGGAQTGIYPRESPGGWNILGFTDPECLIPIEPGDTIEFKEENG